MDMRSWLSPQIDDRHVRAWQRKFAGAKPFPHVLLKGFLREERARSVAAALGRERFEEKDSDLFQLRQTVDLSGSPQRSIQEFYRVLASKEFSLLMQEITGIRLRAGKIDMAGSLYIDTDFLLCHDDELQGRKIAYVYYLCEDFDKEDGGALALLEDVKSKPGRTVKRYFPMWNSLMLFAVSKKSWHEVEEVISKKERYAIGGVAALMSRLRTFHLRTLPVSTHEQANEMFEVFKDHQHAIHFSGWSLTNPNKLYFYYVDFSNILKSEYILGGLYDQ